MIDRWVSAAATSREQAGVPPQSDPSTTCKRKKDESIGIVRVCRFTGSAPAFDTHQVAAAADAHYVVSKQVKEGRTISEITLLDKKSRVTELARMLGGQTDAARKHAEALLKKS